MERGFISRKLGVSYAKRASRTGTRGFWPLDLDLRAKNRSARDLIVAVQIESGGSDPLARGAAALCCRVAGDGDRGLRGSIWVVVWPWGMMEARVIHWSGRQGAAGFVAGCLAVGAARCGGASPASSAPAPRGRPRPKHLAQMNGRVVVRLTELGIGRGSGAAASASCSGSGRGRRFAVRVAAVVLRAC